MTNRYFTDREHGPRPRDSETIAQALWATIVDLVDERMQDGALGLGFPYFCPDGHGCAGCDTQKLGRRVGAEIPDLPWPLDGSSAPDVGPIMDLLEFVAANVGQPIQGSFHSYFGHHHLDHERDAGLAQWRADLNRLFARNGVAFEMDEAGLMQRLAPEGLREALAVGRFDTSDAIFRCGRDLAAWIGLVPRQNSSGGKERLGSICKAGHRYLRQMLVVGAMAVIRYAKPAQRPWLAHLLARRKAKVAAVALANKTARTVWAMMITGERYRAPIAA